MQCFLSFSDANSLDNITKANLNRKMKSKTHKKKLANIKAFVQSAHDGISDKISNLNGQEEELAAVRREQLSILNEFIFPLEAVRNVGYDMFISIVYKILNRSVGYVIFIQLYTCTCI